MPSQLADEAEEHTPLLRDDCLIPATSDGGATAEKGRIQFRTQLGAILFVCVLYFNIYVSIAPETSIEESIICEAYYKVVNNDALTRPLDYDCTVDEVQRELSLVSQVYLTIQQLPGCILSLLYGMLADRIGRRKILLLSIVGIVLCDVFRLFVIWQSGRIPLRAIWLAPIFRLIGGGDAVSAAMVLTALADVYAEQDRITLFGRVAAAAIVFEIVSPLIGNAAMLKSPWVPIVLGMSTFVVGASLALALLPETLAQDQLSEAAPEAHTLPNTPSVESALLRSRILATLAELQQSLVTLLADKNIVFLMVTFFATTIGTIAGVFELQYLHKRFGWSYPYAASILAIRPSITLLVLMVIIPTISKILVDKFGFATVRKDLLLARVSAACLTVGTLLLCISQRASHVIFSIVIFSLGNSFTTLAKSLLLALGPHAMAGTLLSAMNMSLSLGALAAGPMIAVTFDWGSRQGGIWLGSPLLVVTLFYGLTFGFVCAIKAAYERQDDVDDEQAQS